jgi:preprotein translocase subunit SecG
MSILVGFVVAVFVAVSILLVIVILLQDSKGEGLSSSAFGGSGLESVLGGHGATTFLSKMTTWTAISFMAIALFLMKFYGESSNLSPIQQTGPVEQAVDTTDANPDATDNSKVETTDSQTPENPANESDSTTGENEGE